MLSFNPQDPFPLLPTGSHSYAEAQLHAEAVDAWLGLQTKPIEALLINSPNTLPGVLIDGLPGALKAASNLPDQQPWIGLPVRSMLTPYTEFRSILAEIDPQPGQTVVDLGAGYGRMGFVIARHYPEVAFLGYELVSERVAEFRRCLAAFAPTGPSFRSIRMECADLAHPALSPAPAQYYFLYDFGTREAIAKVLEDLRAIARSQPITVVGRGRASRDEIEQRQPWLSQVQTPRHFPHYSIYRS